MASHKAPGVSNRAAAFTVVGLTAGSAALIPAVSEASPAPTYDQVKSQVATLNAQAEAATQNYDAAEEQYTQLLQKVNNLQGQIATESLQLHQLQHGMGLQASAMYESGGTSPALQLLLTSTPDVYLTQASAANETGQQDNARLKQLNNAETQLRQDQANASALISQEQTAVQAAATSKAAVQQALQHEQQLLNSLTAAQRNSIQNGGGQSTYNGPLPPVSGRAGVAVAFAKSVVGHPYESGGTGSEYYDCSGLTMMSWRAAGVSIERTSFQQWASLPHVPLSDIQPGDLVFYNPSSEGPGHVTIYIGDGMLIQAPHPGGYVEYQSMSGAGMTLVGVARP